MQWTPLAVTVPFTFALLASGWTGAPLKADEPAEPLAATPLPLTSPAVLAPLNAADDLWDEVLAAERWVFLGDSNTYSGGYVAILDAWLKSAKLPHKPQLLNLGMSSETVSGESEVDHPFKRPCVHERVRKVLAMTGPDVVFVCYGMNDGIYQPPSEENLAAYREGMLELAGLVRASGAKLICLTPPIFEPDPLRARGKLGPTPEGRYAYFAPAEGYDQVLQLQSEWCLKNAMQAALVIDLHSMLAREKARRAEKDPAFSFSKDGVHFGTEAHALVAEVVLKALGADETVLSAYPDDATLAASQRAMTLRRDAYLAATGKNRPGLPAGWPVWFVEKQLTLETTEKR